MGEIVTASEFWEKSLADPQARIPVDANEPQPGRYRSKRKGGGYDAIAIWSEGGEIRMLRDGRPVNPDWYSDTWVYCCGAPITADAYDRMTNGEQASDPVYAQLPADPARLLARIKALGAIPSAPGTPEEAERLADAAHCLKTIEKKADDAAKEIAEPLKAKIAEQCGPWAEVSDAAKTIRAPIMAGLARYLAAKNSPHGVKGQLGKAISLRTDKSVEVFDLRAALMHFASADEEAFRPVVEKLARAAMKDGRAVPGVREIQTRRAQ